MYPYLVTTTTVDDTPRLVVIGHLSEYTDHFQEQSRICYYPGRWTACQSGMRVAKSRNIAIVNVNTWHMSQVIQLLSTNPFHTFDANMRHIDLHAEFPEVFL